MKVLLTGGAGYIGSHTCVELLNADHEIIIYDNFSNSRQGVIDRVNALSGKQVTVIHEDIRNQSALEDVISKYNCEAIIHFAGLKSILESGKFPLEYYENNVSGTVSLLRAMQATVTKILVFSSSATVYGTPQRLPLTEDHPLAAINPYSRTKLIIEDMLRDLYYSDPKYSISILRYFNPVGAHKSGLIGEDPQGIPNNLMPFIAQVAIGRRKELNIWGNDYPTPDGTGIRDYVHVVDLARAHLQALERLKSPQCTVVNLGTGKGYSVLDLVKVFEKVCGRHIPYRLSPRRHGDVACCFTDTALATSTLDWKAKFGLEDMCEDTWNWQQKNPKGYTK